MKVSVSVPDGKYDVVIEKGVLGRAGSLADLNRKVLVVTDSGVPAEYAEKVRKQCRASVLVSLPQGEKSKTLENFAMLCRTMLENGFTRNDCAVAVGGGVVTDITGFAAASYMRGIAFYNVPTTLLAQTDASVGGKTAVDLDGVKNIVGAFWQPRGVLIDPEVLRTLDRRQFASGMAEIIKTAVCLDKPLFELIKNGGAEQNIDRIIYESVRLKAEVVAADEKETGLRRVLNFGHTVGHAVETLTGLLHGESVAVGMTYMCSDSVRAELLPVLKMYGLPTETDTPPEKLLEVLAHDKKSDGNAVNAVFVNETGSFEIKKVTLADMKDILIGNQKLSSAGRFTQSECK